jgi:hypothetical protein
MLRTWLIRLKKTAATLVGTGKAARLRRGGPPSARPRLEALEDRLALSPYTVQGTTLIVNAPRGGQDAFTFSAGTTTSEVTMDDIPYTVNPNLIHAIVFNGNGGTDQASLITGPQGGSILSLRPDAGRLTGANYTLTLNGIQHIFAYGVANDTANLYGGFTTNSFVGKPTSAEMSGSGYDNVVSGFTTVQAHGMSAFSSADRATLYGSTTSTNWFAGAPNTSSMAGKGYEDLVSGFSQVEAHAGTSSDHAVLYGATIHSNTFVGMPTSSRMTATGCQRVADGFRTVTGIAGTSADQAFLFGATTSSNAFAGGPGDSGMEGSGYSYQVRGFGSVAALAGTPADSALLYGSKTTLNTYKGGPTSSTLSGSGYQIYVEYFGEVIAYAGNPGDTAYFTGSTTSTNHFIGNGVNATSPVSRMSGSGYDNSAHGFGYVSAQAGTSSDWATIHGLTTSRNTFVGTPTWSEMSSLTGDVIFARGFPSVVTSAVTPGDVATFFASHNEPPTDLWWDSYYHIFAHRDGDAWGNGYDYTYDGFGTVNFHQI